MVVIVAKQVMMELKVLMVVVSGKMDHHMQMVQKVEQLEQR